MSTRQVFLTELWHHVLHFSTHTHARRFETVCLFHKNRDTRVETSRFPGTTVEHSGPRWIQRFEFGSWSGPDDKGTDGSLTEGAGRAGPV